MKHILRTALILGIMTLPVMAQAAPGARTESIAAVVNGDAVTVSDLSARLRLIMASSGMPNTDDMRRRIEPQVVNMLVDESLMMQEAGRQNISVSDQEVQQGFAMLSSQNKFTPDQFRSILARAGVPIEALYDQIRAQLAWTKVLQKKVRPQIEITETQIDAALAKMKASTGAPEYLVAEITLPFEGGRQEAEVKQLAERLTREMAGGKVPFSALAAQFSQSSTASKGGDMGWVSADQLPDVLRDALAGMKKGQVSRPLRTPTAYTVLMLRNTRQITAQTLPSRDDIRQRIGMQQLDRMQRRYLLDLKSAAFIERRV